MLNLCTFVTLRMINSLNKKIMSLEINNITNKARQILENYNNCCTAREEQISVSDYVYYEFDNDENFMFWLLDYNEKAEDLSIYECESLVRELVNECNYIK